MANIALSLDSENLRALYAWLDAVPLSRPKRNIAEDFADGVMMAEVFAFFVPKLVDMTQFTTATDDENKRNNWRLLNQNVFSALEIRLSDYTIIQLCDAKSGIVEQVLWELRRKLQDSNQHYSNSVEVLDVNLGFSFREISGLNEVAKDRLIWKAILAEFLGTLALVLVGCGSCLQWGEEAEIDGFGKIKKESTLTPAPSILQISLAFGIIVATMTHAIGHISGGHVNPAVTLGMLIAGKMKAMKAVLYIIFQCVGGVTGAAILRSLTPGNGGNLGMTSLHPTVGVIQALGVEFIITIIYVLTVFGGTDENRTDIKGSVPLATGLAITALHLSAFKFTGSSMNPARTFGPAAITRIWTDHWIYWAGPCCGGAVAGLLYANVWKAQKTTVSRSDYDPVTKGDPKAAVDC